MPVGCCCRPFPSPILKALLFRRGLDGFGATFPIERGMEDIELAGILMPRVGLGPFSLRALMHAFATGVARYRVLEAVAVSVTGAVGLLWQRHRLVRALGFVPLSRF